MTYCVGILVSEGLVFLGDSRTNAGVDQISTFRKVSVFERPGDRVMVLMTSGNLAITQELISILHERIDNPDAHAGSNLMNAANMFEATRLIGDAIRDVYHRDAPSLKEHGLEFNAALIFGGQIGTEHPRLFHIYAAGNFIEATADTPYFQIGESKYGKPILDRVITRSLSLQRAVKCALVSMDSTIRSNLSVGLPLDLVCVRRDTLKIACHINIDANHEYNAMINRSWSDSLRHAFHAIPDPDWL
ncbi:MAG TPA: proteasome-type protease [Steroidobacteraceae bacterium]|jgi:putative proteasome-type protease|nr:proteasome-type protease [Steroidobacteraceae bacterium]